MANPRLAKVVGFPAKVYFSTTLPAASGTEYPTPGAGAPWSMVTSVNGVKSPGYTVGKTDMTDQAMAVKQHLPNTPEVSQMMLNGNRNAADDTLFASLIGLMVWMAISYPNGNADIAYGSITSYGPQETGPDATGTKYQLTFDPSGTIYTDIAWTF